MKKKIYIQRFGVLIPQKGKSKFKALFLVFIVLLIFCSSAIFIQNHIKGSIEELAITNDLNAAWIGSLASYWGGIIGGVISGLLTVIGVAWTIKYYRNSDLIKSLVENMPFLMMEVVGCTDKGKGSNITSGVSIYEIKSREVYNNSEEQVLYYRIKFCNIGQGFAKTLVLYTGENSGGMSSTN